MADARGGDRARARPHRPGGAPAVRGRRSGPRPAARCSRSPRPCARPRTSSRRSARPGRPGHGRATTRAGRRCRTSGSARAATPSAAGSRCCAGCAHPATTRPTAAQGRGRAGPLGAPAAGQGARRPRARRARARRRRRRSRTSCGGSPTRRTPGSTWSRSAASSRSAAASSTCSRRPRSTRCGWSSGATTSRRSAASRSPTSAPSRRSSRLWAPPCRELLLTDEVRAPRPGSSASATRSWSSSPTRSPPASRSRAWSRWRPALVDEMELLVDLLPADTHVLVLDPERVRRRAHDLVATSEEFLGASLGRRGRRRRGADRPRRGVLPLPRRRPRPRPRRRPGLVVGQPVRARRRRPTGSAARPRRRRRSVGRADAGAADAGRRRRTAATSTARSPTRAAGARDGYRVVVVHPGHGPAQRTVEALGEHDVAARLVDDARATRPPPSVVTVTCGCADPRLRRRRQPAGRCSPARTSPASGRPPATCGGCRPGASADRPARAQRRRLRRPRAARRRPLRGDEAARGRRRDPRVPRARVRRLQARRPAGQALRPGRRARPGHPVRRRRAAQPRPARRRRLGQAQGPGPQGGPPDRGRADQAVRRPAGHQGLRVRPGHAVAARARGRVPVPRDRPTS